MRRFEASISVLGGEGSRWVKVYDPVAEVAGEDLARLAKSDNDVSFIGNGGL